MVLGSDGRKMSKSLGNYIATPEVFGKYGADAARQWVASGGVTGSDIPFRWADVEYGWRFLIKLWNAARFASQHLKDYSPTETVKLELLDKWLLSKLAKVIEKATSALETCQFNIATEEIRNFTWHTFCDSYIEAVKHRLYKPETHGEAKRKAAQHTLYVAIYRILQLLAPFIPHTTEEIYQTLYAEDKKHRSIHVSPWPVPDEKMMDEEAEKHGDLTIAVIEEIRRDKAEKRKPLNTIIKNVTIYAGTTESADILDAAQEDIMGTCKIEKIKIIAQKGKGKEIRDYPNVRFVAEY